MHERQEKTRRYRCHFAIFKQYSDYMQNIYTHLQQVIAYLVFHPQRNGLIGQRQCRTNIRVIYY